MSEVVAMDVDVAEPVVEIKSGQSQEALLATLEPCKLSQKHKDSALERLREKTVPGKPQPNTPAVGDCRLWTGYKDTSGYGGIGVSGKMKQPHRIAFEVRHDVALPRSIHVRHLCANTLCVRIEHLAIGTAQDNANDKVETGRSTAGEKHPGATITAEAALAIYKSKLTGEELSIRYNCSKSVVNQIRAGWSWSSITGATKKEQKTVTKSELDIKDEEKAKRYVRDRVKMVPDEENEHHLHWIWTRSKFVTGYGQAAFHRKTYNAHIFAYRAFRQCVKIPDGMCVLHSCKRRDCVNPDGLRLGTRKENMADRVRDGTDNRGEKHKRAKLNDGTVLEIRRLASEGVLHQVLADRFGVCHRNINRIVSRHGVTSDDWLPVK